MSYRHLSLCEREIIAERSTQGDNPSQIGRLLNRHTSTISRELKRHRQQGRYDPRSADQEAQSNRRQARHKRRQSHAPLWAVIRNWLKRDWSPQIISAKLVEQYPQDERMRLSPETLYQWIYSDAENGGTWHQHLWRRHRKRRPHGRYAHLRFSQYCASSR